MTVLTIELPDEQKAALAAKAQAKGLSAWQYARQVLEHDLAPEWHYAHIGHSRAFKATLS